MGNTPMWFMCPNERKQRNEEIFRRERGMVALRVEHHEVVRTGKTKPNPSRLVGSRALFEKHEIVCKTCGHHGWTVQGGVLQKPIEEQQKEGS